MLFTIDIGTSTFKTALWDFDGKRLSFKTAPLSIIINNGIKHEADPSSWETAFEECCKKTGDLSKVQAIVISGNGPSLVPVLEEGKPENARLWLDRRACKYTAEITEKAGSCADARFFLPKIYYIKKEENELYQKTKYFLGCPEYLAFMLTGHAKTVFPCEGFDFWFWNDQTLKKLDLDSEKFPPFIRPADLFGELKPHIAEKYGFVKNIPVISGGPDFFAAILGSGITEAGQACDRTGSSEGINLCTKNCVNDKRLMSYSHPIKPFWNLSGTINTTGKAIEWASSILNVNTFDDFIALAKNGEPGSKGLVFKPYLAGVHAPHWDSSDKGIWHGINLSTGRSEFASSVLEGIGFAMKEIICAMEESGEKGKQLHVTGGLAGCGVLNQIKADITGLEVLEGVYKEAEMLGLAIIGSVFLGRYSSFKEASLKMVKIEKKYKPNIENKTLYNNLFNVYKKRRD